MANSFDDLEKEGSGRFDNELNRRVYSKVTGTVGTVRFVGKVADVYLGRLMQTVAGIAGANSSSRRRTTNPPPPHSPGATTPPNLPHDFTPPNQHKKEGEGPKGL